MEYARRDTEELGELYLKHLNAMTIEGLHEKSAIAAELAYRDAEIQRLTKPPTAILQTTINTDFRTNHLKGEQLKIANIVKQVIGADASGGGCRAFYTPQEWADRGEQFGRLSLLILVHDGGDLAGYCNPMYERGLQFEAMLKALGDAGYRLELCTGWYCAVYAAGQPECTCRPGAYALDPNCLRHSH